MAFPQYYRLVPVALAVSLLTGCASATKESPGSDYFARDMPGLISPAESVKPLQAQTPVDASALIRDALLSQHERWEGTPYRLGGTSSSGIDCSALVQNIYSDQFNIDLPRTTRHQVNEGAAVTRASLEPGDLVFFRPPGSRHVGIYVGDDQFLHASSSRGVMISSLDNVYWKRYYWKSRRPMEAVQLAQLSQSASANR
ncbi:C40 family peptidase [Halomonas halocynthiae]|uniref:C40 family peptidase n=1 Tax=Halomonas halocynthiae TaxID=176290 RepID=UPI0004278E0F|nr:NlpC/P60 family protein [Halomonas halocynthiae]